MMTNRKRIFILEYLKDFNATRAAKAAGYSERTARSMGHHLLTDIDVKQAIDARIMSADEAATIITDIARGDIADLMALSTSGYSLELLVRDANNELIPNPKTKLVKRIKQKVTTYLAKAESDEDREVIETELELYSAHEAARDILKYRGKMVDRSENLNLDLSTLTDEQLEMLRQGKDLADVLKHSAS